MDNATPHEAYSALDRDVQATLKEARQAREIFSNLDGNDVREFIMIAFNRPTYCFLAKTKIEMDIDLNDLGEGVFRMTFHLKEVKLDSAVTLNMRQIFQKRKRHHPIPLQFVQRQNAPSLGHGFASQQSLQWRSTI